MLTLADALRLAINTLRDAAESRRIALDDATAALHTDAADQLERQLDGLRDYE